MSPESPLTQRWAENGWIFNLGSTFHLFQNYSSKSKYCQPITTVLDGNRVDRGYFLTVKSICKTNIARQSGRWYQSTSVFPSARRKSQLEATRGQRVQVARTFKTNAADDYLMKMSQHYFKISFPNLLVSEHNTAPNLNRVLGLLVESVLRSWQLFAEKLPDLSYFS